jgi:hypothetical protein
MRPALQARELIEVGYEQLFHRAPPWRAARLLLAQSRGEGRWGELGGTDAAGDYYAENWGAVQAQMGPPCPPGTFEHGDSRPTANGQVPFTWCFIGYPPDSPESAQRGVRDFLRHALVLRPKAAAALLTGDSRAYARALYGNGKAPYFGGFGATVEERIGSYVRFLDSNAAEVDAALGLPPPAIERAPVNASNSSTSSSPFPFVLFAAAAAGYLLIRR